MANLINTMKKQELVDYIVKSVGNMAEYRTDANQLELENELKGMLKKELVVKAERLYADTLQEEPADAHEETLGEEDLGDDRHSALEEPVTLSAKDAKFLYVHFKADFYSKRDNQHNDWEDVVEFKHIEKTDEWVCTGSVGKRLNWMSKTVTKKWDGPYQKGVQRELVAEIPYTHADRREYLTGHRAVLSDDELNTKQRGRYGSVEARYFSNDPHPDWERCSIGKPIAKGVSESDVQVTASDPVPF